MNYLLMKSIIEATIAHFVCKECEGKISERDVSISGSFGQTVNMEVHCPHCHTQGVIKAEINVMKQPLDIATMEQMGNIVAKSFDMNASDDISSMAAIKDDDIVELRNKLKTSHSVADFFQ